MFGDGIIAQSTEFSDKGVKISKICYWLLEYEFLQRPIGMYSLYYPLSGSSYNKLPKFIYYNKAIVNICNGEQYCFAFL